MTKRCFCFTFFLLICFSLPLTATAQTVDIPDPNLRAIIEDALGKTSGATVTRADMERFIKYDFSNANIRDLTGLEHATSLKELNLSLNTITDISPLRDLTNLTQLFLAFNAITDISALRDLTNLTRLSLWYNSISNISVLSNLTNLTILDLDNNAITDISSLRGLTNLTRLFLSGNTIANISVLSGVTNLTELDLSDNTISDLSPLASNTGLGSGDEVDVTGNPLSAVSINTHILTLQRRGVTIEFDAVVAEPVDIPDPNLRAAIERTLGKASGTTITTVDMANLTRLVALNADISDLTGLEHATNLTQLRLGPERVQGVWTNSNSITDISVLQGLTNLTLLGLDGNNITDISAVSGLTNLTQLDLDNNAISNISALQGLTNLTLLGLDGNNITGISAVSGLTNLTLLFLGDNNISDLSAVSGLTNLTFLDLEGNSISDLSAVSGLTNLTFLDLDNNAISNISALQGLTNLTLLGLDGNNITDISALRGLINLTFLDLDNNAISNISPLVANTGLGSGNRVWLEGNPLSTASIHNHILALQDRGVEVRFDAVVTDGVDIPDPNLRAKIEEALGKASGATITAADMAILTVLEVPNANISDLTGLEAATNLTELDLGGEYIEYMEGYFDFANSNSVWDLSALSGLTNLTRLDLEANSVADISPLSGLNSLTTLSLRDNRISDILPLAGLINLTELWLDRNKITDISPVAGLTNLTWLWLGGNSISDISPVAGLTNLTDLTLASNPITDISPVAGLTNLTALWLESDIITDISSLSGLTSLTVLTLVSDTVTDISPLSGLTNLTRLVLHGTSVSNISTLANLTNLRDLQLEWTAVSDISTLANLTNLTQLTLRNNSISDISPVAGLTNLTWLWLGGNSISDISPVAGLTNLIRLYLNNNSISDISPVVGNTGLGSGDQLLLQGNPLSHLSINTHIPTLQRRGVTVEFDDQAHPALLKVSGDNQEGMPGETLAQLLVVEARDTDSLPLAGIPVTFTVVTGGGTLSATHTTTDGNGRTQSLLTLGPNPGLQSVSVSATGIVAPVTFHAISEIRIEYLLSIPTGISLIHVPLKVTEVNGIAQTIESIGDLYDALGGADTVNFLITYDSSTQAWRSFFVPSDKGTPTDRRLTDDIGIIAGMRTPTSVQFRGDPLGTDGSSTITLNQGLNLVGLPLRDSRIIRVSDLLKLDGIGGNVPVIILTDSGEFKLVGRAGDPGDVAITGGQAFIMTAQRAAIVDISGEPWTNVSGTAATSPVALTGIEVGDTTPVLALRGTVVDEGTGLNKGNFRVTVKNLSTGRAVTTVTAADEAGYRSTVVDIETGYAARVGDILEISAQSPNPFIGVEPLRYTVTAEDVKQSLIQLPNLIAYEIPAETELLHNYPNPFNPETWIPYRLAEDAFVALTIYDQAGQVVRTLDVGHQVAAVYESRSKAIYWDGRNGLGEQVASGVYFYHLSAGDYSATRRLVILK